MTRMQHCGIGQGKDLFPDHPEQQPGIAAGEIGAAHRTRKDQVAAEDMLADHQRHAARRVPGCMKDPNLQVAQRDDVPFGQIPVHWRGGVVPEAEPLTLLGQGIVEELVGGMEVDRDIPPFLEPADAADMVHVRVGIEDGGQLETLALEPGKHLLDFVARVDVGRLSSARTSQQIAVFHHWGHGPHFDQRLAAHHRHILPKGLVPVQGGRFRPRRKPV